MTLPVYRVDGGVELHGVMAAWDNEPLRQNDNGTLVFSDWKRHIWTIAKMPVSTFLFLATRQGETLTSLETTDYDDPNEAATYTNAVMGAVNGQHVGLNVRNVTVEFRVKLT